MSSNISYKRRGMGKVPIQYTEVVVIGNGPSGISLSYLLTGNWPYYSGAPHPDEYLQLRLEAGQGKSLVEQDLDFLSSGLEGRSSNPVALLFDALSHPNADLGANASSLLTWKYKPDQYIPHVVLGKGIAGGAWQMMEGELQTLSLGNWMELPNMPFKDWLLTRRSSQPGGTATIKNDRASMEEVRCYYTDYLKNKKLLQNFQDHHVVTSVERVLDVQHSIDCESGEQEPCSNNHCGKIKWEVRGHYKHGQEVQEFCYRAPDIVLATGTFDLPNRLCVPGESQSYILHSLHDLESAIDRGDLGTHSNPLVVVGAGLSAADAILCALQHNIPTIHIFRRDVSDPSIMYAKLPRLLYPEYHEVYALMKGDISREEYRCYPEHHVVEFKEDGKILVRGSTSDTLIQASYAMVQIGSRPDLSFLPHEGRSLGLVPNMPIDCKHNPVDIDPYNYQSTREHGLFAMGPLVGDNFVRFLTGGALGISSHLWRKKSENGL